MSCQQLKPQGRAEARDEESTRDGKRKREGQGDHELKGEERTGQRNSPGMDMKSTERRQLTERLGRGEGEQKWKEEELGGTDSKLNAQRYTSFLQSFVLNYLHFN